MKTKSVVDIMRQRERICSLITLLEERLGGVTQINIDDMFGDGHLRARYNQLRRRYADMQRAYEVYYMNVVDNGSNIFNELQVPMNIYMRERI